VNSEQLNAGFVRNRRFLIVVSIALACANVLGLRFTQLNILGNVASINNPERVALLGWAVWAWAVAQYCVWYKDIGAWRAFRQAIIDDCEQKLGRRVATEKIPDWVKETLRKEVTPQAPAELANAVRYTAVFQGMHGDGKTLARAADIVASAHIRLPDQRGEVSGQKLRFEREIQPNEWRRCLANSTVNVLLTRRFALEYFAPFLIALLPFAPRLP
jgi:hypothetical protein